MKHLVIILRAGMTVMSSAKNKLTLVLTLSAVNFQFCSIGVQKRFGLIYFAVYLLKTKHLANLICSQLHTKKMS